MTLSGTYSNPAGQTGAAAARYTQALLGLLGNQEPLAVLRAQPAELRRRVAELTDEDWRRPEAPGKWAVRDVLQHLADTEIVHGYRFRLILAEETPPVPAYDQDRWAGGLHYDQGDWEELLDEIIVARRRTLRLLESLGPDEWARGGHHAERGFETVAHLCKLLAAHDLVHRRQIDRIRAGQG